MRQVGIVFVNVLYITFIVYSTILLAGHETAASALSWALYEISRNPKIQDRMRTEIHEMEAAARARGHTSIQAIEYESMPYITAVIKVTIFQFFSSL
jgi:cytochrome P450